MVSSIGSAPAKIILFGEHAVVYRRPAIAVPVNKLSASVEITANPELNPGAVHLIAPDIHLETDLSDLSSNHPLLAAIQIFMAYADIKVLPACTIKISSTIPVASGMGSGAAVTVALLRSLAGFSNCPMTEKALSELTFEVEKIYHGTPSGIDNTVIAYNMPVYFIKDEVLQTLRVAQPFNIIIGGTGIASSTAAAVGDVRKGWLADPQRFDAMFDAIGEISRAARRAIEDGNIFILGRLMNENQAVLQDLGVSSPELNALIEAARGAGALGAKLSGGGRGGNMIALVNATQIDQVCGELHAAGAHQTISTIVK